METFGAVEFGVVDFLSKSHSSSAFVCHHKRWIILNKSCVVFSCTNKWKNVKQDKRSLEIPKCLGQVLNCGIVKMSDYLFYQIINLSCSCAEHVDLHPMSVFRMMWTLYKFILTLWNQFKFPDKMPAPAPLATPNFRVPVWWFLFQRHFWLAVISHPLTSGRFRAALCSGMENLPFVQTMPGARSVLGLAQWF